MLPLTAVRTGLEEDPSVDESLPSPPPPLSLRARAQTSARLARRARGMGRGAGEREAWAEVRAMLKQSY